MRRYYIWRKRQEYTWEDIFIANTNSPRGVLRKHEGAWECLGYIEGVENLYSIMWKILSSPDNQAIVDYFIPSLGDLECAYIIVDDRGKIRDYETLVAETKERTRRRRDNTPDYRYRCDPVPNVWSHHRSKCYRSPHTAQEIRTEAAYAQDYKHLREEYPETRIQKPRGRRKKLPTFYDDPYRDRQRSWKHNRAHQYRLR